MGHIFRREDAEQYEAWFRSPAGRVAEALLWELLLRLWKPASRQEVLDVGCGPGLLFQWLVQQGHCVTGIDPSPEMLDMVRWRVPHGTTTDRGFAEDLPYDDNAFDTVFLVNTLEFVEDPLAALHEAFRVSRRQVIVAAWNRYSLTALQNAVEGLWRTGPFKHARLFSVLQLRHLAEQAMGGPIPAQWHTGLVFPRPLTSVLSFLERWPILQEQPLGHLIAMRLSPPSMWRTLQDPLFCQWPHGIEASPSHSSCYQTGVASQSSRPGRLPGLTLPRPPSVSQEPFSDITG